jgi:hypothetical protein
LLLAGTRRSRAAGLRRRGWTPVSPHLLRKLQEVLGAEAARDLVTRLEGVDACRGDIAELRHEMQLGFAKLEGLVERTKADLMKWSFVFWVGAVAAIAALAGVLR